mmetsp:Transcript_78259/g.221253  ORF Transcript_78259/g.221253 Transcript_78259/m.221253 type:complete len:251 (-) Transcript_78259:261-1013(-)
MVTPGLLPATAAWTSSTSSSRLSPARRWACASCRQPMAVVSNSTTAFGRVPSRLRPRRNSTHVGAQHFAAWPSFGDSPASAAVAGSARPPASFSPATPCAPAPSSLETPASSSIFFVRLRWHPTRNSSRKNSPQSLAELGSDRRPRRRSVRAALTCPSFSSRSAAKSQRCTLRGWYRMARKRTLDSFFVLPLRRQKSMYWYQKRTSALNLSEPRSKMKMSRLTAVKSLMLFVFHFRAFLRRRRRHSSATS